MLFTETNGYDNQEEDDTEAAEQEWVESNLGAVLAFSIIIAYERLAILILPLLFVLLYGTEYMLCYYAIS